MPRLLYLTVQDSKLRDGFHQDCELINCTLYFLLSFISHKFVALYPPTYLDDSS